MNNRILSKKYLHQKVKELVYMHIIGKHLILQMIRLFNKCMRIILIVRIQSNQSVRLFIY